MPLLNLFQAWSCPGQKYPDGCWVRAFPCWAVVCPEPLQSLIKPLVRKWDVQYQLWKESIVKEKLAALLYYDNHFGGVVTRQCNVQHAKHVKKWKALGQLSSNGVFSRMENRLPYKGIGIFNWHGQIGHFYLCNPKPSCSSSLWSSYSRSSSPWKSWLSSTISSSWYMIQQNLMTNHHHDEIIWQLWGNRKPNPSDILEKTPRRPGLFYIDHYYRCDYIE